MAYGERHTSERRGNASRGGDRNRSGNNAGGDGENAAANNRRPFFRRSKSCPFASKEAPAIDWKDIKLLNRFLSERGKIMPCRISSVSMGKQRILAQAVKRARFMALVAYARESGEAA